MVVRMTNRAARKPRKQLPRNQKVKPKPEVTLENVTLFNIEKLGLRSDLPPDFATNFHHYVYGTERGR